MDSVWQQPEDWQKDGSTITGLSNLKTGAWTALYKAQETVNGKSTEVILKTFTVPDAARDNQTKIAAERQRFLDSARLAQSLVNSGARAWVAILRVSENPPSYTMPKCGPSLQGLIDHKVNPTPKDLYQIVRSVLQALIEIKSRHGRSHGDLKPSNVLSSLPGETPPYKLSDPTPKGQTHWANDLYNLGLLLYELLEHKAYDPLTPLAGAKNWSRLGARRDRWTGFLGKLLSPNGCQESPEDVMREALRLKPPSPLRPVLIAVAGLIVIAAGVAGYFELSRLLNRPAAPRPAAVAALDPQIKNAYDQAHQAFQDARTRWSAAKRTPAYDHTQSIALARAAILSVDGVALTDAAAYSAATDLYKNAAAKLDQAIAQAAAEEQAGIAADQAGATGFQQAQHAYEDARAHWIAAAANFAPGQDHTRSKALADAATLPSPPQASADPAARQLATAQYQTAAAKFNQALTLIDDENHAAQAHAQALALFQKAREQYRHSKETWDAFANGHKNLNLTAASNLVDQAVHDLPDQFVLTDDASYRAAADQSYAAAQKIEQALAMAAQAKPLEKPPVAINPHPEPATQATSQPSSPIVTGTPAEIAAAVQQANHALETKNYSAALALYKKASDLGSPAAMCNVGLLYETGTGTEKDYAQAAAWYKKAADRDYAPGLCNLASLYEAGRGVDQNFTQAHHLYEQAAALKSADAMVALGRLSETGRGADQDSAQALAWYKKAADLNNPAAITNVGVFYEQGKGVPADYTEALRWYKRAAAMNYPAAMNALGMLYDSGKIDNTNTLHPDHAEAFKWYTKAADLDDAPAMCNLGALYDNGQGVPLDHAAAFKWFTKSAQRRHPMAMYNLGVLYETGRGTTADHAAAITWYRKAAHSEDPAARRLALDALNRLGFTP